jgi:hypothetical protein
VLEQTKRKDLMAHGEAGREHALRVGPGDGQCAWARGTQAIAVRHDLNQLGFVNVGSFEQVGDEVPAADRLARKSGLNLFKGRDSSLEQQRA